MIGIRQLVVAALTLSIFAGGVISSPVLAESALLKQGIQEYNGGDYTNAVGHLSSALSQDFNNAVLHYYLASAFVHLKLKDDAIREFRIAYALQPDGEAGRFSKQALIYLGAESDGAAKKAVELKPAPPHVDTAQDRAAALLRMQAEQLKAMRTGLSQGVANDVSRRGEETMRRTGEILSGLPNARRGDLRMPPDAARQLEILRGMFDSQRNNALQSGASQAQEIQRSAENLQSLLNEKNGHRLDPVGTNLYIRNYKGEPPAATPAKNDAKPKASSRPEELKTIWGKMLDRPGSNSPGNSTTGNAQSATPAAGASSSGSTGSASAGGAANSTGTVPERRP